MCEYCDLKNYRKPAGFENNPNCVAVVIELLSCTMAHNLEHKDWAMISNNEYGYRGMNRIHYCPFCGRKLEENENE